MNSELERLSQALQRAAAPEEVFGALGEPQAAHLKKLYHQLARVAHPDCYLSPEEKDVAQAAFQRLSEWYALAEHKLRAGLYGQAAGSLVLQTKQRAYVLSGEYVEDGLYNRYPGAYEENGLSYPVTLKLVRDPRDNDLAHNEVRALQLLAIGKAAKKFWPYVPRLVESFLYEADGALHQASAFERLSGWYSLEAVRERYPDGIHARDMAWMWRRLLVALGYAHINGLVHGALLPRNVLIQPEQHGLMLVEWSYSALEPQASGEIITAIDPAYVGWYPPEVSRREAPMPGTDILMAARCMIYLLGGDPLNNACPAGTPDFLRAFFKGCTLTGKTARPQDAWALQQEFDELIGRYWGKRAFRPFVMDEARAA